MVFDPVLRAASDDTLIHLADVAGRRHRLKARLDDISAAHSKAIDAEADAGAPEIGQARADISRLEDELAGLRFEFETGIREALDAIHNERQLDDVEATEHLQADALKDLAEASERIRREGA